MMQWLRIEPKFKDVTGGRIRGVTVAQLVTACRNLGRKPSEVDVFSTEDDNALEIVYDDGLPYREPELELLSPTKGLKPEEYEQFKEVLP